ncbi:MAG TPA: aminoglycoside adenylyltransferase domain-containing protein [Ktedonobacterales bacterium]|nr:aminoglycoside adenylyltransferase domain-containing protein [Ktedonobacterales bacterium]
MISSDRLPEEVRAILNLLLDSMRVVLGDQLVGVYLYGSLSSGDFDPASSDVDFLAVTSGTISDEKFEQLRAMHERIAAKDLPFATRLEGSYIPQDALRSYDPTTAWHPTIGVDWPLQIGFHNINWVIERAIVRERGVVLWGPPPAVLIDSVSPQQLREATCQQITAGWRDRIHDEAWLRPRAYSAFAVLTLCRALYTIQHGTYCSKPAAASWATGFYPGWRPMIEWALMHRADHSDSAPDELVRTLAFLREAVATVQSQCAQRPTTGTFHDLGAKIPLPRSVQAGEGD